MGAYGHTSLKPSLLFGTAPYPQMFPKITPGNVGFLATPRRWLEHFGRKLRPQDKKRLAKAKEDAKKNKKSAMVIRTINKKGKLSVQPVRIYPNHVGSHVQHLEWVSWEYT